MGVIIILRDLLFYEKFSHNSMVYLNVALGIKDYLIKNKEINAKPRGLLWKHFGFPANSNYKLLLRVAICALHVCF